MSDLLMWRHWWRHNRIVIYCNFWWIFHAFTPTHINLRPKFLHENNCKSEADLFIYKFKKKWGFSTKKLLKSPLSKNQTRVWWSTLTTLAPPSTFRYSPKIFCGDSLGQEVTIKPCHVICPDRPRVTWRKSRFFGIFRTKIPIFPSHVTRWRCNT